MSIRVYRRITASALLAGSLGLLAATAEAAPATRPGRQVAVASASRLGSSWDSIWSRLVRFFASDHQDAGTSGHGHSGGGPDTDEGPGMCPHGH
jgi:hypothetical protein